MVRSGWTSGGILTKRLEDKMAVRALGGIPSAISALLTRRTSARTSLYHVFIMEKRLETKKKNEKKEGKSGRTQRWCTARCG